MDLRVADADRARFVGVFAANPALPSGGKGMGYGKGNEAEGFATMVRRAASIRGVPCAGLVPEASTTVK